MKIQDIDFFIDNPNEGTCTLTERSFENGILQLDFSMVFPTALSPKKTKITFDLPCLGAVSTFHPDFWQMMNNIRMPFMHLTIPSRLSSLCPITTYVGYEDQNCYTLALSDVFSPCTIDSGIIEENGYLNFGISFFTSLMAPMKEYHSIIYLDMRHIPYHHALADVEAFWQVVNDLTPCYVPDGVRHPFYSFWYSYHQNFTTEQVLDECRLAKEHGMDTVILDDGWQTDDTNKGYAYCGDWELAKTKIPDIKALVDGVHSMGMKIMFWYSVPYIGIHAKGFERFRGMLLDPKKDWDTYCLDPRFPEVRAFLIGHYTRAMKEWNLDGLKLDFIDDMCLTPESPKDDPRMDETSLEKGIEKLLREAYEAITAIKPDAFIEFRQRYIGPAVQAYGNMLRVGDCANDALSNRYRSMQLRLLTRTTAIHSDMLMWNEADSVENAARQFTACFFTVPQISVKLAKITPEQSKMLKFYLSLWEAHRDVLLFGEIIPHSPECNFPLIEAKDEKELFAVAYSESVLRVTDEMPLVYVNSTPKSDLYVDFKATSSRPRVYHVYDCMGKLIESGVRSMNGIISFPVPLSGVLSIF